MALLKIEDQSEPTQNQAFSAIYDLAREISYYIADPRALNTILNSRRQARNLMVNLKLDKDLVYNNAEPILKDWVHILTFETDNDIIEELTVIQKIRGLVLALSEELKNDSGFATYFFQIETLSKLELEATERLKQSKKKDNTLDSGNVTINNTNISNNTTVFETSVDNQTTIYKTVNKIFNFQLTGPQRGILRNLILKAFPNESDLEMLLDETLNVMYKFTVSGDSYNSRVFSLISYVNSYGDMFIFISCLIQARPHIQGFKDLLDEYKNNFM